MPVEVQQPVDDVPQCLPLENLPLFPRLPHRRGCADDKFAVCKSNDIRRAGYIQEATVYLRDHPV